MKNRKAEPNLALARRIRAAGAAIYIEEDDGEGLGIPLAGLRIRQFGGVTESRAFDLSGATGYILCVAITFNLAQFAISSFELELPYQGVVRWLDDPMESDGCSTAYRFPCKDPLEFERNQVLNRLADVRWTYSKGQSVSGMLLGIGTEPIPDDFKLGKMIPGFLIVTDQFAQEYRSPVELWADRVQKIREGRTSIIARRGRLFDRPDRKPAPLSR
jgi:hypothetical protein